MVYSWTYTDCDGNTHDWTHTVTVDMPDFTMPDNTSETVDCVADIVIPTPPTVTDACGVALTPVGNIPDPAHAKVTWYTPGLIPTAMATLTTGLIPLPLTCLTSLCRTTLPRRSIVSLT